MPGVSVSVASHALSAFSRCWSASLCSMLRKLVALRGLATTPASWGPTGAAARPGGRLEVERPDVPRKQSDSEPASSLDWASWSHWGKSVAEPVDEAAEGVACFGGEGFRGVELVLLLPPPVAGCCRLLLLCWAGIGVSLEPLDESRPWVESPRTWGSSERERDCKFWGVFWDVPEVSRVLLL